MNKEEFFGGGYRRGSYVDIERGWAVTTCGECGGENRRCLLTTVNLMTSKGELIPQKRETCGKCLLEVAERPIL